MRIIIVIKLFDVFKAIKDVGLFVATVAVAAIKESSRSILLRMNTQCVVDKVSM